MSKVSHKTLENKTPVLVRWAEHDGERYMEVMNLETMHPKWQRAPDDIKFAPPQAGPLPQVRTDWVR